MINRLFRLGGVHDYIGTQDPLTLSDDDDLIINRLVVFHRDYNYRQKWVNLDECTRLYEARTDQKNEKDLPRRNLIRTAVDDHHAVKMMNRPKVEMFADRGVNPGSHYLEKLIYSAIVNSTEKVANGYIRSILMSNDYDDLEDKVFKQSSIYGFGVFGVTLDESLDTQHSPELRALIKKPLTEWDETDAATYAHLGKRIQIDHYDSRHVFWQDGVPKYGKDMLRVSYLEEFDLRSARIIFEDDRIMPANLPHHVLNKSNSLQPGTKTTSLTTWERIPYRFKRSLETIDGETEITKVEMTDWVLLKTRIVGGVLVEKKVYGTFAVEEKGIEEGSTMLPLIPVYDRESDQHPYGYSLPEQLRLSEEFINRMYFIMYKSARKAVSAQPVFIHMAALGKDDLKAINAGLDEGGAVPIWGNEFQRHNPDISRIVQPLPGLASQISPALLQAVSAEERAFTKASGAIDQAAISRSRSGSGKRAQISVDDRPKTITRALIARGLERLYETIWDNITIHHTDRVSVLVDVPNAGREMVVLNDEHRRYLPVFSDSGKPVFDPAFVSPENPSGLVIKPFDFVMNSTALRMKARSDGRSELPSDMISRLQVLIALVQNELISKETARDLTLPDYIKAIDDINMKKQQRAQAQQLALQQQLSSQNGGGGTRFPTLDQAGGNDILLQDSQTDIQTGADDLSESRSLGGV